MKQSFGPWTTALNAGNKAQLKTFWKRRLGMLPSVSRCRCIRLRMWLCLVLLAAVFWMMPTLFLGVALAEAEPALIRLVEGGDLQSARTGDETSTTKKSLPENSTRGSGIDFPAGQEKPFIPPRSGLSLDLVTLAESYIDASTRLQKEEAQLQQAQKANTIVLGAVSDVQLLELKSRLDATRRKISLFGKIVRVALESAEEELKIVTSELNSIKEVYAVGEASIDKVLLVQRREAQVRSNLKMLKLILGEMQPAKVPPRKSNDVKKEKNKNELPVPKTQTEIKNRIRERLGLKLEEDDNIPELARTSFHGGLRVVDVEKKDTRPEDGIRKGDILVGLQQWETTSLENVDFVLSRKDVIARGKLKFYVIRDKSTLYGTISIAQK